MDMIFTDQNYKEYGYLKKCEIDMELGSSISSLKNDFKLTMKITDIPECMDYGSLIYQVGTEYGGIVRGIGANTSSNEAYVYGICWRGKLSQEIIEPHANEAYYEARGEANTVIRDLIDSKFEGLIVGSDEISGITVNRDFRYTNLLEGLEKMLNEVNARLDIKAVYDNNRIVVKVSAVSIKNFSNDIELNNDYGISLVSKKIKNGVNHVICLGKGELTDRQVIHLYKLENGTITQEPSDSLKGLRQNTKIYDYSNAESIDDLINGGKKLFDENNDDESLDMSINTDVEIGDIVAGRERITGIYMQKPVSQKIIKGHIDNAKIEYKVGE